MYFLGLLLCTRLEFDVGGFCGDADQLPYS